MTTACGLDDPERDAALAQVADVRVEGQNTFAVDDEQVAAAAPAQNGEVAPAREQGGEVVGVQAGVLKLFPGQTGFFAERLREDVEAQTVKIEGDVLCLGLAAGRRAVGLWDVRDHRECSFLPRSQAVTAQTTLAR